MLVFPPALPPFLCQPSFFAVPQFQSHVRPLVDLVNGANYSCVFLCSYFGCCDPCYRILPLDFYNPTCWHAHPGISWATYGFGVWYWPLYYHARCIIGFNVVVRIIDRHYGWKTEPVHGCHLFAHQQGQDNAIGVRSWRRSWNDARLQHFLLRYRFYHDLDLDYSQI